MPLSAKAIRNQLALFRPLLDAASLDASRKGQNLIGGLMEARFRKQVITKEHTFDNFTAAWMIPKDERRQGVMMYVHGGGYIAGDLEYAKGFGSTLAVRCGMRIFCPAYRLAPENPFPAPVDDILVSYQYLLTKGYSPSQIVLCGESAGGGLIYALCLKLKELGIPLPGALIGISPWTDLTASGESYEKNKDIDPSMTAPRLKFFADCYCKNYSDPLVSPLFGDLQGLPPSLLFVGGDEIMLSDTTALHEKLLSQGCKSKLHIAPGRWHGYLLYDLAENKEDFDTIQHFLNRNICHESKMRWMPLDNAAKIYPAARSSHWTNVFRMSATLKEDVDIAVLQSALDVTARRFPSIACRIRRGMFWYYLQQLPHAPAVREENSYPLAHMSWKEVRKCAFRVIVYKKRIAVEFFHSLTDGTGATVFLKTLLAEYLQQKYDIRIPPEHGVLGRLEDPSPEELEDSFLKHAGPVSASRRENTAWRLTGTPELDGFLNITCFRVPVDKILEEARHYGVSLSVFLCAVMMQALLHLQEKQFPNVRHRKHVRVQIPVNLRRLFPSKTLRNFAYYTTPEVNPRLGQYTFPELCKIAHHTVGLELNPQHMASKIAANVNSELLLPVKIMPLFLKNIVMKLIFNTVGERKSCLSLSNLGIFQLPESMVPYVDRVDFILSPQAQAPHNCGAITFGDTLNINFTRDIQEPDLEREFFCVLRDLGIPVTVESNQPQ